MIKIETSSSYQTTITLVAVTVGVFNSNSPASGKYLQQQQKKDIKKKPPPQSLIHTSLSFQSLQYYFPCRVLSYQSNRWSSTPLPGDTDQRWWNLHPLSTRTSANHLSTCSCVPWPWSVFINNTVWTPRRIPNDPSKALIMKSTHYQIMIKWESVSMTRWQRISLFFQYTPFPLLVIQRSSTSSSKSFSLSSALIQLQRDHNGNEEAMVLCQE